MKTSTALLTLFSSAAVVASFAPTAIGSRRRSLVSNHHPLSSSVLSEDIAILNRRELQDEREKTKKNTGGVDASSNHATNVYTPSSSVSTSTVTATSPTAQEKLAELWAMDIKHLKLQCSRRNIRYCNFVEKEDFVQAVWMDMQEALSFSVTGTLRPGMVAEVTGEQLDQEMTSNESLILVDVYATWCGPCRIVVPQLEGAAKQLGNKARVVKLDSDKHAAWAGRYQVQGLPTMLLIKDGRVVDRLEGAHMTDGIMEFVRRHL
ncbi:thioredoxin [Nitzschia inconspicua]|uniref:Thioredoxin n=1 Tax=Nitzschia inconspicua TaxID=303405 RepID=A0A9K3L586_9STRA|nr:thioredoxin [Nitzschia inconspicua]